MNKHSRGKQPWNEKLHRIWSVEKLYLTKIIFTSWEIIFHQDYLGETKVVRRVSEDEEAEKS